ncbi:hypothetical protein AVEN_35305-1 [Araneus ventricosus]|uniref:Uncharacterized protein n=1 Tax=Araneus ventricosus TaxID=182803 RepID=A0A4Y2IJX2_ARAVE|nr:hypothetical protein AVEN_35305-1 [Araneus ventricosus]
MPPNRLLQQYEFHMTTTTGDITLQASRKSSNARVQQAMVADSWFTENNFTNKALSFVLSILVQMLWLWIKQVLITITFAYFHPSRSFHSHLSAVSQKFP